MPVPDWLSNGACYGAFFSGGAFLMIKINGIVVFSLAGAFSGVGWWVYTLKLKKSLCGRFNGFFMKITFFEKNKEFL